VDDVLETVDGGNLAFAALVRASDNSDFIVLSDWDGSNIVLFTELLAQWSAHDRASDAGWCIVVSLTRLSPRGVEGRIDLGHLRNWRER